LENVIAGNGTRTQKLVPNPVLKGAIFMAIEDMKEEIFTVNRRNKEKIDKEKREFKDAVYKDATDYFKHKTGGYKTFAVEHIPSDKK